MVGNPSYDQTRQKKTKQKDAGPCRINRANGEEFVSEGP